MLQPPYLSWKNLLPTVMGLLGFPLLQFSLLASGTETTRVLVVVDQSISSPVGACVSHFPDHHD